jgi:hypothetical protein
MRFDNLSVADECAGTRQRPGIGGVFGRRSAPPSATLRLSKRITFNPNPIASGTRGRVRSHLVNRRNHRVAQLPR